MKIYHFVQTVSKNSGGLRNSICNLTSELNELGFENKIINGEDSSKEFNSRIIPINIIKLSANFSIKDLKHLINWISNDFLKSY